MSLLRTDSVYSIFVFAFRIVAIFMVAFKHFMPNVYQHQTHTYFTRLAAVAWWMGPVWRWGGGGRERSYFTGVGVENNIKLDLQKVFEGRGLDSSGLG